MLVWVLLLFLLVWVQGPLSLLVRLRVLPLLLLFLLVWVQGPLSLLVRLRVLPLLLFSLVGVPLPLPLTLPLPLPGPLSFLVWAWQLLLFLLVGAPRAPSLLLWVLLLFLREWVQGPLSLLVRPRVLPLLLFLLVGVPRLLLSLRVGLEGAPSVLVGVALLLLSLRVGLEGAPSVLVGVALLLLSLRVGLQGAPSVLVGVALLLLSLRVGLQGAPSLLALRLLSLLVGVSPLLILLAWAWVWLLPPLSLSVWAWAWAWVLLLFLPVEVQGPLSLVPLLPLLIRSRVCWLDCRRRRSSCRQSCRYILAAYRQSFEGLASGRGLAVRGGRRCCRYLCWSGHGCAGWTAADVAVAVDNRAGTPWLPTGNRLRDWRWAARPLEVDDPTAAAAAGTDTGVPAGLPQTSQ